MHTKEPWIYGGQYGDKGIEVLAGDELLAVAFHSGREFKETMDNAHLIAAAPEMYEALQAAQTLIRNMKQQFNCSHVLGKGTETIIEQALDKAEGRA